MAKRWRYSIFERGELKEGYATTAKDVNLNLVTAMKEPAHWIVYQVPDLVLLFNRKSGYICVYQRSDDVH